MHATRTVLVFCLLSMLIACGGGGGDSTSTDEVSDTSLPPGIPDPDAPGLRPPQQPPSEPPPDSLPDPPADPPSDPPDDPPDDPPVDQGVTDEEVGDTQARYVNIEFSPDMRYAIFLEQTSQAYDVWMSDVDPDDGTLIPADGRGQYVAKVGVYGMGQWGEDAIGQYVVVLDLEGHLVIARPQPNAAPAIEVVTEDPDDEATRLLRAFPFPSRNLMAAHPQIVYQLRTSTTFSLYLVDLGDPMAHELIHQEAGDVSGQTPASIVSFQRWLPDSAVFTHGVYTDCNLGICLAQVQKVDMTSGTPISTLATDDISYKVDAFPFWGLDGNWYLLAGDNHTEDGELLAYDASDDIFRPRQSVIFDRSQTDLVEPGGAQSFEPFVWDGEQYATYEVIDLAEATDHVLPAKYPAEIWVTKLADPMITCRVSVLDHPGDPLNPAKQTRVDAEPLVIGDRAWLYYHAGPRVTGDDLDFDLRRIDLGDKARFDEACAAGTTAPAS